MNNTVELIGYYGSDEIIACSAWTINSRELTDKMKEQLYKSMTDTVAYDENRG